MSADMDAGVNADMSAGMSAGLSAEMAAHHGGPDALGAPQHDFSTNANACGPCPHALAAVRAADPTRYPDPAYTALRERLAAWHGVAPARIVVAGSASEFIGRMTRAVGEGAVEVPARAYGDYARAARAHGLEVLGPPAGGPDAAARAPVRLVWACDPASPQGVAQAGLAARIDALPAGVPLVLDLAYEPLRLSGTLALSPAQRARVWQLWSPNKALGLTGLRGAYAIAPADEDEDEDEARAALQQRLLALAPSWPVGAHAQAMLHSWAAPASQQWVATCLPVLRRWKAAQQALCRRLGWAVLDSDSNYFCADWTAALAGRAPAQALGALRASGIKLRDCASFGLPGQVRLGVRPPDSQDALWRAMQALGLPPR